MATRQKNAVPPAPQVNGHDAGVETQIEIVEGASEPIIGGDVADDQQQVADPGIETLREQLAAEQRRREEAEREAATLRNQSSQQQREVVDNRMLVLDATIQRQEGEKAAILASIRAAKEAGDYDAEVTATDRLSQINIDLKQTKMGKSRLESEIEDGGTQQQPSQQQRSNDDPVEDMIKRGRLDPRSANWLRNHREFAEAGPNNDKLQRAHAFAMSHDGVAPATDEYFRLIEERLGLRQSDDTGTQQQEEPRQQQPQRGNGMPPAAPPSRGAGMGGGGREIMRGITDLGNGKFRTSPEIRQFAESIGMTVQDYVAQAVALKNEGQIH